jgi:hypothetical protein
LDAAPQPQGDENLFAGPGVPVLGVARAPGPSGGAEGDARGENGNGSSLHTPVQSPRRPRPFTRPSRAAARPGRAAQSAAGSLGRPARTRAGRSPSPGRSRQPARRAGQQIVVTGIDLVSGRYRLLVPRAGDGDKRRRRRPKEAFHVVIPAGRRARRPSVQDFRILDGRETLRCSWPAEQNLLIQSVIGHAHEGHGVFRGPPLSQHHDGRHRPRAPAGPDGRAPRARRPDRRRRRVHRARPGRRRRRRAGGRPRPPAAEHGQLPLLGNVDGAGVLRGFIWAACATIPRSASGRKPATAWRSAAAIPTSSISPRWTGPA